MTFYTIHPRELEDIMRRKHGILIDVREADSYREYHYPNARNLPYEKIDQWMAPSAEEQTAGALLRLWKHQPFWRRESSAGRGMRYIPWLAALRQCEQVIDREN